MSGPETVTPERGRRPLAAQFAVWFDGYDAKGCGGGRVYQGVLFEEGIEYLRRAWTTESGDIDDHQLSDRRTLVAHWAKSAVRLHR